VFRSSEVEVAEGDRSPAYLVVHEWPTALVFWGWRHSDDYRPWAEMRRAAASINLVTARGCF
jgi:uncharacterized protein (DUF1330 family)